MRALVNQSARSPGGRPRLQVMAVRYGENDAASGKRDRMRWRRPSDELGGDANEQEERRVSWSRSAWRRRATKGRANEEKNLLPPSQEQDMNSIGRQVKTMLGQTGSAPLPVHDNEGKGVEEGRPFIDWPVFRAHRDRVNAISAVATAESRGLDAARRGGTSYLARNQNHRRRRPRQRRTFIRLWPKAQRAVRLSAIGKQKEFLCLLLLLLMQISLPMSPIIYQANCGVGVSAQDLPASDQPVKTHVRVGILLEESNYEQANMFIRTIKMINEQKDETIRQLLGAWHAAAKPNRQQRWQAGGGSVESTDVHSSPLRMMQNGRPDHEDDHHDLAATATEHEDRQDRKPAHRDGPTSPPSGVAHGAAGGRTSKVQGLARQKQQQQQQRRLAQTHAYGDFASDAAGHSRRRSAAAAATAAANESAYDNALGQFSRFDIKLDPMIEFLRDRHSALEADEKVCQLIESGVQAIFGPVDGRAISHVQSICDNLEIPYFELRSFIGGGSSWSSSSLSSNPAGSGIVPLRAGESGDDLASKDDSARDEPDASQKKLRAKTDDVVTPTFGPTHVESHQAAGQTASSASNKLEALTVNLYPPGHLLNSAYIDLIYALNWTSFAVVYDDGSSMIRLQNIFKESSPASSWANKWRIRLFRYDGGQPTATTAAVGGYDELLERPTEAPSNGDSEKLSLHDEFNVSALNLVKTKHRLDSHLLLHDKHQASRLQRDIEYGGTTGSYRDVFWRVKLSGEHNILLDVKSENLYEALKQAQQVGCMTEEYSYLITSLDLHMINLEDFKYSRTKITGLSLLQVAKTRDDISATEDLTPPKFDEQYLENLGLHLIQQSSLRSSSTHGSDTRTQQGKATNSTRQQQQQQQQQDYTANSTKATSSTTTFNWLNEAESNDQTRREMLQSSPASLGLLPTVDRNNEQKLFDFFLEQQRRNLSRVRLSTSSAILHDSLILFMLGLSELDPSGQFLRDNPDGTEQPGGHAATAPRCSLDAQPWAHGSSLVNYMKQVSFTGLTGLVSFDQRGLRSDFKLDVLGMAPNLRLVKVGEWHSRVAADEARNKFGYHHLQASAALTTGAPQPPVAMSDSAAPPGEEFAPAADANVDAQMDSKSYDELSSRYETQLKRYHDVLASGGQVHVPYRRRVSPNGALQVNEIIFERLYREQADKVDTLIVTAKLSQPYFMLKETPSKLDGNDQFEGYAVDLIHELSKLVNFRYKWREVADKKYGSKEVLANGTVVWNGMIGEIVRGTADLAIVDLTITAQREEAVDFTLPFMNTGISILFKKPTTKVTTLFSFLSPFSSDVWAYVLAAYCGISAILFLVGHLSPYEWADPHPCRHLNPDSDLTVLKNQFSLLNSFWFTIGSLMQQGSDLTPRSMSTRTIAGIWYFFTLIMISSYTANLAAFLTVEKVVYPIENVRDLSNQQEIKYGCVESGSTCLFFHDSQIDTYKKIDETMRRHRTYVRSNDEGQKRVGEGKFAFFMESTTIEYIVERNCNLTQIGGLIDSKGYGLATSKKSRHKRPYRTLLNEGILHLQETGMLHVLKNRWWKEKRGGGTCTDDGKGGGVTELSLANVGGVFVVLLGGLGISFLVAIAEFIWRARRSGSSRDRMCEEMMNDLKFALACKSSTKPIQMTGNGNNFKRMTKLSRGGGSGGGVGLNGATDGSEPTTRLRSTSGNRRLWASDQPTLRGQQDLTRANGVPKYYDKRAANEPERPSQADHMRNQRTMVAQLKQTANNKQCDPILLHAMLTMLSSNPDLAAAQAELDLAASNHRRQFAGPLLPHSSTYDENLSRQVHLMPQHSNNSQTNLELDDDEEEYDEEFGDEDESVQQQQQQQQPVRADPPRRRQMLWSQQTIDTD